jgi:hypothetical protein
MFLLPALAFPDIVVDGESKGDRSEDKELVSLT